MKMDALTPITRSRFSASVSLNSKIKASESSPQSASTANGPEYFPHNSFSADYFKNYNALRFGTKALTAAALRAELKTAEQHRIKTSPRTMSFDTFINDHFLPDPAKHSRNPLQYLEDAIFHHGVKPTKVYGQKAYSFDFTQKKWQPPELTRQDRLHGQELPLTQLFNAIHTGAKQGRTSRTVYLFGPPASGKTNLLESMMQAVEEYNKTPAGETYTFSFVFPAPYEKPNAFGLYSKKQKEAQANRESEMPKEDTQTETGKPGSNSDEEFQVSITANLNTPPIFLLPPEQRRRLLPLIKDKLPPGFNVDEFLTGKLDANSNRIYEALLDYYKGDSDKVLRHVKIHRWNMSTQNRQGLVVSSVKNVGDKAVLQPLRLVNPFEHLPPKYQSILADAGIHELNGTYVDANRGILLEDDALKGDRGEAVVRGNVRFTEKGSLIIEGHGNTAVEERLNLLTVYTVNENELAALREQNPDLFKQAFEERGTFIAVPYEMNYRKVANVFDDDLKLLIPPDTGRHIGPHALDYFGLWLTSTFLYPAASEEHYKEVAAESKAEEARELFHLAQKLTEVEKARLYIGEPPIAFDPDPTAPKYQPHQQQMLQKYLGGIATEYAASSRNFDMFEGNSGITFRDAKEILERAVQVKPFVPPGVKEADKVPNNIIDPDKKFCFTILEVFEGIDKWLQNGTFNGKTFLPYETKRAEVLEKRRKQTKNSGDYSKLPIPSFKRPQILLDQVRENAALEIQREVEQDALQLVKSPEAYRHNLMKYLIHASAIVDQTSVPDGWHDPHNSTQPNEHFLRQMESIFYPKELGDIGKDETESRALARKTVVENHGSWVLKHKLDKETTPEQQLEQIPEMRHLIQQMKIHDVEKNESKLLDFLVDLPDYYFDPVKFRLDSQLSLRTQERHTRLFEALDRLKALGYCDNCIPKLIRFAFDSPDFEEKISKHKKQ